MNLEQNTGLRRIAYLPSGVEVLGNVFSGYKDLLHILGIFI